MSDGTPSGASPFEFSGGLICLDFANTVSKRRERKPSEKLRDWSDLVRWAREAGIFSPAEARRALRAGEERPVWARRSLRKAVALREALFRTLAAAHRGGRPEPSDLGLIGSAAGEGYRDSEIALEKRAYAWRWKRSRSDPARILWEVSRSAVDLLTSGEMDRLRLCDAETCDWLFMDGSRNRTRRWCDMTVCGNRSKARRHYRRQRAEA